MLFNKSYINKINRRDIIIMLESMKTIVQLLSQIKNDLEELESWWEIECKVYEEKTKRLKIYWNELRTQESRKRRELTELYGHGMLNKVRKKYNIK
jgi:hypothetical protein